MISRHYPDQTKTNNNVNNLSWCEPAINSRDRQELGHLNTVLTEDLVIEIKNKLLNENYTQADIYKEYSISAQTICSIVSEKSWKGVGPNISDYNFDKRRVLTELEISQIRGCIDIEYNDQTIQNHFNLKYSHYHNIKNKKIRPDIMSCDEKDLPQNIYIQKSYDEIRRKIPTEEYDNIKELLLKGNSLINISKMYKVDPKTIYTIKKKLGL